MLILGVLLVSGCATGSSGTEEALLRARYAERVEESPLYTASVESRALRMRRGPALSHGVRAVLGRGETVRVLEIRPDGWCRVSSGAGNGWVWGVHLGLQGVFDTVHEHGQTYIKLTDSSMIGPDGILRVYRRFIPPLEEVAVNDPFGTRRVHPVNGGLGVLHAGVDLRAGEQTEVLASAYGTVSAVAYHESYGIFMDIDHGGGYTTRYAHLSHVLVEEGQVVEKGEPVALSGDTGMTTGPHLHFELIKDGEPVDPAGFMELEERPSEVSSGALRVSRGPSAP